MSEAVERARQRREEEELKRNASKLAAREKLKMLEERLAKRREADKVRVRDTIMLARHIMSYSSLLKFEVPKTKRQLTLWGHSIQEKNNSV